MTLHYEISGPPTAPALLLLNSLGTDLAMWDDQMAEFSERFRVIRYDMRGHGRSSPMDAPETTISLLAVDALAVLDAVEIPIAHWCGLSLGGMVAMWVAAHRPERVSGLVLCNTTAHLPPASMWQSRMDRVAGDGMSAIADLIPERWFSSYFRAAFPEKVERVRHMLLGTDAKSYIAACAAIRDMDQRADLRHIAAPTLVVCGSADPATPPSHSESLVASIAGSKLAVLDAAHLSNVERPEQFCVAVNEFL